MSDLQLFQATLGLGGYKEKPFTISAMWLRSADRHTPHLLMLHYAHYLNQGQSVNAFMTLLTA